MMLPLLYRRRVGTSTSASGRQVHPLHWSHRVTSDNPHGFKDDVLARLNAIEDPAEREKKEEFLLRRRASTHRRRSDAAVRARTREMDNERYRTQKQNTGYVL
jgi:hypothetical protein